MGVIALGTIAAILASTSLNVAAPALMTRFGIGQDRVQLVVTVFMLANTIAMLPSPWLIERFGLRQCFLAALLLLAAGSILGAMSPNFAFLLCMRCLQGCAAGMLMPMGAIIVMQWFPLDQQGRASGLLGFGVILAPAVAPGIGGMLIDHYGWESVLLMSLPFCALAWPGAARYLPNDRTGTHPDFDWRGTAALVLMTVSLLACASTINGNSGALWWAGAYALLALVSLNGFLRHARSQAHAIISVAVFAQRRVTMGMFVSFAYGFGIYGSSYLIPVFLQSVMGLSATQSGGILVPAGIVLAGIMPLAGWLADHSQPRLLTTAGLLLFALSYLGMWLYSTDMSYMALLMLTILGRVGVGLLIASLNQAALRRLHGKLLGQSAMLISYLRMLGGILGVALLAVMVEWRSSTPSASAVAAAEAYNDAFLFSAVILLLAMVAAWRMKED
jgi:DHA2 family multidrug resistance protein